jgi:hypothetical protein
LLGQIVSSPTSLLVALQLGLLLFEQKTSLKTGSSSFWFTPWTALGRLGSLVLHVDIHDFKLSATDILSTWNPHTQSLYTQLPLLVNDVINNTTFKLNETVKDTFIWSIDKNGTYTTKSGYNLLLSLRDPIITHNPLHSWSWIWKLQLPKKIKKKFFWVGGKLETFLFWYFLIYFKVSRDIFIHKIKGYNCMYQRSNR